LFSSNHAGANESFTLYAVEKYMVAPQVNKKKKLILCSEAF
jgi:hypothetical protein